VALSDAIPDSGWMQLLGPEFGVRVEGRAHFVIQATAPDSFSMNDVADLVLAGIDAGLWPADPSDSGATPVWLVVYPEGTYPDAMYAGEHGEQDFPDGGALIMGYVTGLEQTSESYQDILTHELIEALTDPRVTSDPALEDRGTNDVLNGVNSPY